MTPTTGEVGGGEGASRVTWTGTATADGGAGTSSMVIPNTLLIASRGFACKAIAADSTWLAAPAVSVATTVRITLPASTVTVSTHAGKKQRSSWRKLALTESAFASYSSTVPPAFSTKVISLADTVSVVAPGGNDGGRLGDGTCGEGGGGLGGGGLGEGGGGDGDGGGGEGEGGGGEGGGNGDSDGGGGEGDGGGDTGGGGVGGGEETTHEPSCVVARLLKLLAAGAMQPNIT